jgi:DNA-binding MarR family transcriptional regulator
VTTKPSVKAAQAGPEAIARAHAAEHVEAPVRSETPDRAEAPDGEDTPHGAEVVTTDVPDLVGSPERSQAVAPERASAPEREEALSDAFWAVARHLRWLSRATLEPWQITPGQARAIEVVRHRGAIRLSDLSERLHIAPRSTTEVVDGLEERGLIARHPDPADRRATLVTLTDDGQRIAGEIRSAQAAQAERFFGELSEADRTALARILAELRR